MIEQRYILIKQKPNAGWLLWLLPVIIAGMIFVGFCFCAGCDYKQRAEDNADTIKAEAAAVKAKTESSTKHAESIINVAASQPVAPQVVPHAKAIIDDQKFIGKRADVVATAAQDIDDDLDHLENKRGFFGTIILWLKIIGVIIAVLLAGGIIVLAHLYGIGPLFRFIVSKIPWLAAALYKKVAREVEADIAMLDDDDPVTPREVVSSKRGGNTLYDSIYAHKKAERDLAKGARLLQQQKEAISK